MALASAMWAGITGLGAHGDRMSVIGNNIANVNTVGFKSANMFFEDMIYQDFSTTAGTAQVGRGVRVAAIYSDFSQGSFETTNEATDMAIGGSGFFGVSVKGEDTVYYTRSGNFRFDKEGYLVDPHGYVLQGWEVDNSPVTSATTVAEQQTGVKITGAVTDVRLENFQIEPQATSKVNMVLNLDSQQESKIDPGSGESPFFALAQAWNGQNEIPLDPNAYSYETTLNVYDENGSAHELTAYFDRVTLSNAGGKKVWEYVVTSEPAEDGRRLSNGSGTITNVSETSAAGMLMIGTLTFDAAGLIEDMSAYTLSGGAMGNGGPMALGNWGLTEFSTEGYPLFVANFLNQSNASIPNTAIASNASPMKMDFGIRSTTAEWTMPTTVYGTTTSNAASPTLLYSNSSVLPGIKANADIDARATTSYSTGSATLFQDQDGYAAGLLQSVAVDRDGVLSGRYTNGETLELYVIALATFNNQWALRREGGNLFSETKDSGQSITNRPNQAGTGSVSGNTLEMSNVDLANEFVDMITTQRGFQANTKVITSVDQMLGEVIAMKR